MFKATPISPLGTALPAVPGPAQPRPECRLLPPDIQSRLGNAARNLLAIQVRVSELDPAKPGTNASPTFSGDRGPQTDFNPIAMPHGRTSLFTGANNIGAPGGSMTTWNFALEQTLTPQVLRRRRPLLATRRAAALRPGDVLARRTALRPAPPDLRRARRNQGRTEDRTLRRRTRHFAQRAAHGARAPARLLSEQVRL